jgi:hypothetical protein
VVTFVVVDKASNSLAIAGLLGCPDPFMTLLLSRFGVSRCQKGLKGKDLRLGFREK